MIEARAIEAGASGVGAMAVEVPVLDRALELDPQVVIRPESFGAIAYHHGTRRLTVLRHPDIAAVVACLSDHPTAGDAIEGCTIAPTRRASFSAALAALLHSGMIRERAR